MTIPKMTNVPFSPFRTTNNEKTKKFFLSCEGAITEWIYFDRVVSDAFESAKFSVEIINILEDALRKKVSLRTPEENKSISSSKPENLLDKMNKYIEQNKESIDFDNDEFWIIMDVDDHTDPTIINAQGKSNEQKWIEVLALCKEKNIKCAISNPFFELWLLLHFDDANDEDRKYAVTNSHSYEATNHFTNRLRSLNVSLKGKEIKNSDIPKYSKERIIDAISRAKLMDDPPCEEYPKCLGTTVYKLLENIDKIDKSLGN